PERYSRLPGVFVDAFAAAICGIIAWHSTRYILLSIEFGETVLIDTPAWLAHGILPLAFALMCYRFSLYFLKGIIDLRQRSSRQDQPG
ncbi:MAG: TRAP transporter small permease, partial [Woeseiaceae bacterium]